MSTSSIKAAINARRAKVADFATRNIEIGDEFPRAIHSVELKTEWPKSRVAESLFRRTYDNCRKKSGGAGGLITGDRSSINVYGNLNYVYLIELELENLVMHKIGFSRNPFGRMISLASGSPPIGIWRIVGLFLCSQSGCRATDHENEFSELACSYFVGKEWFKFRDCQP